MLYYILQIIVFQVVFLLVYDVFLKRETFFNYNRIYLIVTAILSFVIPFIKLDTIKAVAPKDFVIVLPEVIIGNPITTVTDLDKQVALEAGIVLDEPSVPIWQIIFWTGMVLASLFFLFKLLKLYWLKSNNPKRWDGNILIVKLLKSSAAFSFFNTVFLGEKISKSEQPTILKHELVHVKQWHSLDLLVFEVMRILLWFNPLVYMYQSRIKTLHEFIADETAVKQNGKISYYNQLLNQVFETNNFSFTNTFFKKSLIKKRIAMLQKSKSKKVALIKYALLIPLVFAMLIYTSAEVKAQEPEVEEITEVIEIQEIDEKVLIEKYYKQMKVYQKADEFSKIMEMTDFNILKFRMSLDEFARLKAFTKITFIDRIEPKLENGKATDNEKEIYKKFTSNNENYLEYIERTKTEEYGRKWETRTEGSTLKLYVKDLKNKTKSEEERLKKKIDLMLNDSYWDSILISDGNQSSRIEMNDVSGNTKTVTEVEEVQVKNIKKSIEVPYAVIENPPTFSECKDLVSSKEKRKCTSNKVAMFVNKNFNTDLATQLGLEGRQRISVFFKIDKKGNVISVGARAPHPALEEEAKRVMKLLPQFIPGTQKGKPVVVPYSLPILFQVAPDKKEKN
ncbi:MAG: hypothetical protein HKP48_03395 [Winogradskyella sp.]|uniref:M56 family metallopeptidase n=1 Tax=Winogradskyella sp. TaxID=1883156 RepID=UPI0017A90FC4|nr:M56 family metallopeptidase [Winogradskyella sp.]MBT8244630.1 M56 family metallopeptidase [Winogradskyella sp.]NNK22352.1 hypothetical protein [Winogradskyella sp.]